MDYNKAALKLHEENQGKQSNAHQENLAQGTI